MAHERKHLTTDLDITRDWRFRLQQEVDVAVRNIGVVRATSAAAARDTLQQRIEPTLNALVNAMNNDRSKRQQMVDNRYEYERLSRTCNGEAQKYVGEFLRNSR